MRYVSAKPPRSRSLKNEKTKMNPAMKWRMSVAAVQSPVASAIATQAPAM